MKKQETFTDIEYSFRKKKTKREEFLEIMDEIIPWDEWVGAIEPYYPKGKRGRPPMGIEKMLRMLSVFVNGFSYAHALGKETDVLMMILLLLGALFVILGNYMPKCKQNHTIGIRIPWTLHQEANWTATHRFAGKLWVTGGLLCMIGAFLPKTVSVWIVTALLLILVIAPIVYSYAFQKKHGE